MGLEPSNCRVDGRASERERGTLQHIEPGGRRHYEVEISVLTSKDEIDSLEAKIAKNKKLTHPSGEDMLLLSHS